MHPILFFLALLTGVSIPLLPLTTGFFPTLGLLPLKLGHRRSTRVVQVLVLWLFAAASFWPEPSGWSWSAGVVALWFTMVAFHFYPQRIFVALEQPERSSTGLAGDAPVLASEVQGEAVAYPLEMIVPHHIVNDVIGGRPILVAW